MNRQTGMIGGREVFMNIMYEKDGDYLIPNIVANPESEGELRKFGLMRQSYLKEWHKGIYTGMVLNGTLMKHLLEVQEEAEEIGNRLMLQIKISENVTENLKKQDQMEWVRRINSIQNRVDEMVLAEVVYKV